MDNYEIALVAAQKQCAGYDMAALAARPGVEDTPEYLRTCFFGQEVRIRKSDAQVTVNGEKADFGQALSVYDWLCDRRVDAAPSGEFCPVSSLPGVYVSGKGLGMQMPNLSKRIDEDPERFRAGMAASGAREIPSGDLGWQLDIFPGFPMQLKFYFGDEEFAPQLTLMWDKNSLQFVRYETLYYIAGCLHGRLKTIF